MTNKTVICLSIDMQVRIGTERGAKVVKVAIVALYVLTFGLGLSRVLPFTCIVSN